MPRGVRKPAKPLPFGLKVGTPVKIEKPAQFNSPQIGLVVGWCPNKDDGIYVWIAHTGPHAIYSCILTENGDTIMSLAEGDVNGNSDARG